ncbi:MAG: ATP-binding cassette domain-containing protein [Rhodospirillaceae bacterium]|nr:ATP-binding cassette domain-containing protein [Rhodospirillaceae bacterium]MYJ70445.1 ATP-binding cassette domain-containing protein [Rhodospirillaceae bacterium]
MLMQLEATDCGAACLGIVLAHFGCWVSLEELRDECGVGRDGSTLEDIAVAARKYGLEATGWRSQIDGLARLPLPMILFWGFKHFVVLERVAHGRYYLNDPAEGHRVVDKTTFNREFTGVGLLLDPGSAFRRTRMRPGVARRLWPWLRGYRPILTRTAIYGLLLALTSLALPVLLALFVDRVLVDRQTAWSGALSAAMIAAGGLTFVLTWLQMRSLRELVVRVSIDQSDRFLDYLLRLPMRFFAHRLAGDLASRMRQIDQIADMGASQLVRLAVDLAMSVAFLAAMLYLDILLALAVAGLGIACLVSIHVLTRLRWNRNHQLRREQGMLAGMSAGGLRMVESLQAMARENDFFSRWSGQQARELCARQKFVELGHVAAALPQLFQILCAAAVFGLGAWRTMSAEMTVGTLIGFYVLASNFLQPVARLAQFSDLLGTLEADLSRMDDVLNAPREIRSVDCDADSKPGLRALDGRLSLVGRLEMRAVTFGFQRNRAPLVEDFSLTIEPGQRVAVVGPSGSGKSTLALLAAGLYRPWSGEVLFDGHPLDEIPREVFSRSVAIVDQHPILFATTVRNNLTMWDATIPDHHVTAAARDAAIHEDIIARTAGYESMVAEDGQNFSGGQRSRLEIARALVNNPSLLILDEATSALDPTTELFVDDRLRRRGCSCLIVAHRLSTIRDCDWIVVVDRFRVVEEGTHDELHAGDTFYRRLLHGE